MKSYLLLFCLSIFGIAKLNSQTIEKPNYGLKSHETLEINKVVTGPSGTTVYLSVVNKIDGGYFCADKNIYIMYPDGSKSKVVSSKGIPVCPASYKFKSIGEKLSFELTFAAIKQNTKWIDLVEDCNENCFSFYGICLNK